MDKEQLISYLASSGLGLERDKVAVSQYQPKWQQAFAQLQQIIKPLVGTASVHHFGSTSIVGCSAKPVLDIGIEFDSSFVKSEQALADYGFNAKWEYGLTDRYYFTLYDNTETLGFAHIHAYPRGHQSIKQMLAFRNAHLNNAAATAEYSELKTQLVSSGIAREDYANAKTAYVQRVLANYFQSI